MAHPYGTLPYGLLHRDILQIAVDQKFTTLEQRVYSWILVNVNPYTGELNANPTVDEVAETLKMSRRHLYDCKDKFIETRIYTQEKGVRGMKGNAPHVSLARKHMREAAEAKKQGWDLPEHPYAHLIGGKIPREFVRIAVEKNVGKFCQRHFWYITLNLAPAGHLTRLDEIEDIGKHIGTNSTLTMLRSFKKLQKTGLFSVERPSAIQGQCELVVAAMEEAAEQRRKMEQRQAYRAAMTAFLKRQEKIYGQKYKQPGEKPPKPAENWVREMKKAFRQHYEETGEFLTEYF